MVAHVLQDLFVITQAHGLQGNLMVSRTTALQRELDLSYNNFTGPVPAFLAKSSVPSATLLKMSLLVCFLL